MNEGHATLIIFSSNNVHAAVVPPEEAIIIIFNIDLTLSVAPPFVHELVSV